MKNISKRAWVVMFCAALSLIIAVGVIIAVQARKTINDSAFTFENVKKMKVNVNFDYDIDDMITYDPEASAGYTAANFSIAKANITMQDVYERADVIAKVKATDDRSFVYNSILVKAVVTEVYKGDPSLKSEEICIYEYMFPDFMLILTTHYGGDGYNIMNTGEEYYLFLNRRSMPDGYMYTDKDQRTYLLTNVHMGKYKVNVSEDLKVLLPLKETAGIEDWISSLPDYQQVKEWDILPVQSEQIDFYLRHREEALELLKIEDGQR